MSPSLRRVPPRRLRRQAAAGVAALLLSIPSGTARAQGFPGLAEQCAATAPGQLAAWCREASLGARAVQGATGLAVSGGSDLPGTASTLGRRLGRTPRISLHAGVSGVDAKVANVLAGGDAPAPESSFFIFSARLGAQAGVFDGFSLGPTVGGLLSVDLLGSWTFLGLPSDEGFEDGIRGFGYGARLGLVRESFSLPGVSVSWVRRGFDDLGFGEAGSGAGARVDADLTVSSIRATVGKELFTVSFLGGYGWDRYESDISITARPQASGPTGTASARDLSSDRTLWFASGSLNFLLFQITGEAGWASGFDRVFTDRPAGGYDPTEGSAFATLAFRLTL